MNKNSTVIWPCFTQQAHSHRQPSVYYSSEHNKRQRLIQKQSLGERKGGARRCVSSPDSSVLNDGLLPCLASQLDLSCLTIEHLRGVTPSANISQPSFSIFCLSSLYTSSSSFQLSLRKYFLFPFFLIRGCLSFSFLYLIQPLWTIYLYSLSHNQILMTLSYQSISSSWNTSLKPLSPLTEQGRHLILCITVDFCFVSVWLSADSNCAFSFCFWKGGLLPGLFVQSGSFQISTHHRNFSLGLLKRLEFMDNWCCCTQVGRHRDNQVVVV